MSAAIAGGQVDQDTSAHLPGSPDHLPPPGYWEPEAKGRGYIYVGLALVVVVLILVFVL